MDRFISYSTNHEDVLLHRAFRDQPTGFYIDVGAFHPVYGSVTKALYDRGWTGVNIEPNPAAAAEFARHRPRDVNLTVGVGSRPGRFMYHAIPGRPQLSTLSADAADRWRANGLTVVEHPVEVTTLADVCAQYVGDGHIDVLSVDTEGAERDVLLGADFSRWRPTVLLIEATVPETNRPNHHHWEPLAIEAGYEFTLFDGINRVYVRDDYPQLADVLRYPVNCLDQYVSIDVHDQLNYLRPLADAYINMGRPGRWAGWPWMMAAKLVNRLSGRRP